MDPKIRENKSLTREQIENVIREALLSEGFLDRVLARAKGNTSARKALKGNTSVLKALGQRPIEVINLIAAGKVDLSKIQDPKIVKSVIMAVQRIKSYQSKFAKLLQDFTNDLELMFGGDLSREPQIKHLFDKLDNSSTSFAKEMGAISDQIAAVMVPKNTSKIDLFNRPPVSNNSEKSTFPELNVTPQQQSSQAQRFRDQQKRRMARNRNRNGRTELDR